MSHTTQIEANIRDISALKKAVKRIPGAAYNGVGPVKHFSTTVNGHRIQLPGFQYEVAVDKQGQLLSDTYEGRWGDPALLDQLTQYYTVECARAEAEANAYQFDETKLKDGSIKCVITTGGSTSLEGGQGAIGGSSAPSL